MNQRMRDAVLQGEGRMSQELPEYLGCCECEFGQFRDKVTSTWFIMTDGREDRFACSPEHRDKAIYRGMALKRELRAPDPSKGRRVEVPFEAEVEVQVQGQRPFRAKSRDLNGANANGDKISEEQKQKALRQLMNHNVQMSAAQMTAHHEEHVKARMDKAAAELGQDLSKLEQRLAAHTHNTPFPEKYDASADVAPGVPRIGKERWRQLTGSRPYPRHHPQQYVASPPLTQALDKARSFRSELGKVPLDVRADLARTLKESIQAVVADNIRVEDVSFTDDACREVDIALSVTKPVNEIVIELNAGSPSWKKNKPR